MGFEAILFVRRTVTDVRVYQDQGWLLFMSLRNLDRTFDCHQIIPIFNGLSMPAIGIETFSNIFGKGQICGGR